MGDIKKNKKCPNCNKELPKDKIYCNEKCTREYYLKLGDRSKDIRVEHPKDLNSEIEQVLDFMVIKQSNMRRDAYNHWLLFVKYCKKYSGKNYEDFISPRLRGIIGVGSRFIREYLQTCLSWEIIKLQNGNLIFIGIPEKDKVT